ncbi:hypothetical protein IAU59_004254 [Kwoniella sp. CBS 9459]
MSLNLSNFIPRSGSTASVDRDLDMILTDSDLDELKSSPSNSPLVYVPPPFVETTVTTSTPAQGEDPRAAAAGAGHTAAGSNEDGVLTKFQLHALDVLHQLCALDDLYFKLASTMDDLPHPPDRATRKILLDREDLLVNPATGVRAKRTDRLSDLEEMVKRIATAQRDAENNLIPERLLGRLEKHHIAVLHNPDIVLGISTAVKDQVGLFVRRPEPNTNSQTTDRRIEPSMAGLGFCCFTFPRGVNDVDAQGFNDDLTFEHTYQGKQRLIVGLGIARVVNHSCRANVEWPFLNPLDFKTGTRGVGYMAAKLHRRAPLKAGDELFGFYGEKFGERLQSGRARSLTLRHCDPTHWLDCKCEHSRYHPGYPQSQPPQPNGPAHVHNLFGRCATPGPSSYPGTSDHPIADHSPDRSVLAERMSQSSIAGFDNRGSQSAQSLKRTPSQHVRASISKRRKTDHASTWDNADGDEYEYGQETDEDYTPEDEDDDDEGLTATTNDAMSHTRVPTASVRGSSRRVTAIRALSQAEAEEDESDRSVRRRTTSRQTADDGNAIHVRDNHLTHPANNVSISNRDIYDLMQRSQETLGRMEAQLAMQDEQLRALKTTMDNLARSNGKLLEAVIDQRRMLGQMER